MATEHYFTTKPADEQALRAIRVQIADHDYEVVTAGGVFSPEHIDIGTQVLLRKVPAPQLTGNLLDLGCGWGPIALTLAKKAPSATVWAVDVNERALDLVRRNAARLGVTNLKAVLPEEVPADISFSTIWSNPPIRVGKTVLHELLDTWINRLTADGSAWLVVAKHLGAESLQRWLVAEGGFVASRYARDKGFQVIEVGREAGLH